MLVDRLAAIVLGRLMKEYAAPVSTLDTTENADPTAALIASPAATETAAVAKAMPVHEGDFGGSPITRNRRKNHAKSAAKPAIKSTVASKVNQEYDDTK